MARGELLAVDPAVPDSPAGLIGGGGLVAIAVGAVDPTVGARALPVAVAEAEEDDLGHQRSPPSLNFSGQVTSVQESGQVTCLTVSPVHRPLRSVAGGPAGV